MTAETSILCTLAPTPFKERLEWLAKLRERSLIGSTRSGRTLTMLFSKSAEPDVLELVRREKACCEFLQFETTTDSNGVLLTITVPEEAGFAVDEVFDCFAPKDEGQES